ncbi:MAG: glycosyltransferase family 4 protein [Verrucomicrobiota bacterium]
MVSVPMYLPLMAEASDISAGSDVFFGAVSLYLQQKAPGLRVVTRSLQRLLDSAPVLKIAAKRAGTVRAGGLGSMTLSMLEGRDDVIRAEAGKMIEWLRKLGKIDLVHFSNALILGLAPMLKKELGAGIVCHLQDEHQWVDALEGEYVGKCWRAMSERAGAVEALIAVSRFYADYMALRMKIDPADIRVVYPGVDVSGYPVASPGKGQPVIGYLSRLTESLGLSSLIEAFLMLKKDSRYAGLKLKISGGGTSEDRGFVDSLLSRCSLSGCDQDVEVLDDFDARTRKRFFESLALLCVPCREPEAIGGQVVEALASGVPVVHPDIGGAPELIKAAGGGKIVASSESAVLAEGIGCCLEDREWLGRAGRNARRYAENELDVSVSAAKIAEVYSAAKQKGVNQDV